MNDVCTTFDFEQLPVRVVTKSADETWFALKDVCEILDIRDDKQVFERLDDDEKGGCKIPTIQGEREMRCVNEPGLYTVIIRSNSEKAKPFRRWITHDVLPSIRKQGYYSAMSDDALLSLLSTRLRENPRLIKQAEISRHNEKYLRSFTVAEQVQELWGKRFDLSQDEYTTQLANICDDDLTLYSREWCKYNRWRCIYRMSKA